MFVVRLSFCCPLINEMDWRCGCVLWEGCCFLESCLHVVGRSVVRTYRMSLGRFSGLCKATQMLMFLFLAKGTTFLSALSSDETVISCEEKITFAVYS